VEIGDIWEKKGGQHQREQEEERVKNQWGNRKGARSVKKWKWSAGKTVSRLLAGKRGSADHEGTQKVQ